MIREKTIEINSPAWAFWDAICSPKFNQERGGHYQCNWIPNSQLNWLSDDEQGNFCGKILQVKKMEYLSFIKYDNFQHNRVIALVSYQIRPYFNHITVKLSTNILQSNNVDDQERQTQWLTKHLIKIALLAQKIALSARNDLVLS